MLRAQPLRHARPQPLVHDVIRFVDVICLIQERPENTGAQHGLEDEHEDNEPVILPDLWARESFWVSAVCF